MSVRVKSAAGVLGCLVASTLAITSPAAAQRREGLANPASTFCVAQGGRLVMRGSTGYCHLPGGRVIEEWAFFRQEGNKRPPRDGKMGMGSPAAEHCSSIGGRNVTRRDRNGGEMAYCRLKNGRTVDAWELFRQSDRRGAEPTKVTRYCTETGGRLLPNDDGTHGCRTREGDVFGAQQYYDMHHDNRD